jgi:hypothetical protein
MGLIRALVAMVPRLQAEEAMTGITAVALGTGSLDKSEASSLFKSLSSAATGGKRPRAKPASPHQLAMMGIGYHEVTAGGH